MAKTYDYRTYTDYRSDTQLSYGIIPNDPSWHTTSDLSGSKTAQYYYRDTNIFPSTDANSSRVIFTVTDSWTASIDNNNNLSITLTTVIDSIVRDDIRGSVPSTPGRDITLCRYAGGPALWVYNDTTVGTPRTLATGLNLGTETFVLPPGVDASRSSFYVHNQVSGETSFDDVFAGVMFRNTLPVDYRPGMIWDGNTWQSHNRDGGWAGIYDGSTYKQMRTVDGGTGTGNPPSIRHDSDWRNMRKIGANG